MNSMRKRNRRSVLTKGTVLFIAVISIIFGLLFSLISGLIEKKLYPRDYSEYVEKYAAEYGVPEAVVYAVIKAESDFDRYAVSSAETPALGLMQITEETFCDIATWLGEEPNLTKIYDPETNIRYGTYYLSRLFRRYENWDSTYAAYNAGPGTVNKWLKDPEFSDENGNLINIEYPETRNYVKKVTNYRLKYEKLYYNN